jgi:hypothetical protein
MISIASVFDVRFLDLERLADPLGHGIGIGATTTLVVADHVLSNAELVGELGLRQTGLETGAIQEVADTVLLHFLPVLRECPSVGRVSGAAQNGK